MIYKNKYIWSLLKNYYCIMAFAKSHSSRKLKYDLVERYTFWSSHILLKSDSSLFREKTEENDSLLK